MTTPTEAEAPPKRTTRLETADITRIMELLPHRYPMLMIDRLEDIDEGVSATGIKNVTINEPFFQGHFPGRPIMPGVLIVEAMAQTAGALVQHSLTTTAEGKFVLFMTIKEARFRRIVQPGDTLRIPVKVIRSRPPVWRFEGKAFVGSDLVAEAEYSAMIRPATSTSDS